MKKIKLFFNFPINNNLKLIEMKLNEIVDYVNKKEEIENGKDTMEK